MMKPLKQNVSSESIIIIDNIILLVMLEYCSIYALFKIEFPYKSDYYLHLFQRGQGSERKCEWWVWCAFFGGGGGECCRMRLHCINEREPQVILCSVGFHPYI